jgi:catechol 2,3-dioxygenase-like lactoylglutathione lyase family enzyme
MKIIELEILSANLAETESFYKRVLGLEPYQKEDRQLLFYRIGHTKLIFRYAEGIKPVYHFAIDLPNNRFFDCYSHIKQRTPLLPVEKGDDIANFVNWDAKSFYFLDNNGNIIEGVTRYPNRQIAEEPFGSQSYIGISEIGFVTNNVPELADTLLKEHGVPIFHRQPRGDKFTVSGDDEGLFILAEKGRDWYPTHIKAYSFRTRVLYYDNGHVNHILR